MTRALENTQKKNGPVEKHNYELVGSKPTLALYLDVIGIVLLRHVRNGV